MAFHAPHALHIKSSEMQNDYFEGLQGLEKHSGDASKSRIGLMPPRRNRNEIRPLFKTRAYR